MHEGPPPPHTETVEGSQPAEQDDLIGPVTVGPIAHGGHFVARYEGRVIFVRHALPGEQALIKITDDKHPSYWRADAVTILEPSPERVAPACPISGPGGCGGCDFQHVELAGQRRLKAAVLAEQLQRLAGLDLAVEVEEVPLDGHPGFGWRTRVRYLADDHGRWGLRAHRSHQVVALPPEGCRIAAPQLAQPTARNDHGGEVGDGASTGSAGGDELIGVAAADGTHWLAPGERRTLTERAVGRDWQVAGDGFWQVHPAAAHLLAGAVLDGLQPEPGDTALDLYCGVGLFAGALVDRGCRVTGVESSRSAIEAARRNLADARSSVRFVADRVDRALSRQPGRRRGSRRKPSARGSAMPRNVDLVVLDPPRSGVGGVVVEQIVLRHPRAIAYVACDPAALARDLGYLLGHRYRLASLRAFDLFPMTHHLESVAILRRVDGSGWTEG